MTFSHFIVHYFTAENGYVKFAFHTSQFAISHFTFLNGQPLILNFVLFCPSVTSSSNICKQIVWLQNIICEVCLTLPYLSNWTIVQN